jgi:hypothetical protein
LPSWLRGVAILGIVLAASIKCRLPSDFAFGGSRGRGRGRGRSRGRSRSRSRSSAADLIFCLFFLRGRPAPKQVIVEFIVIIDYRGTEVD